MICRSAELFRSRNWGFVLDSCGTNRINIVHPIVKYLSDLNELNMNYI